MQMYFFFFWDTPHWLKVRISAVFCCRAQVARVSSAETVTYSEKFKKIYKNKKLLERDSCLQNNHLCSDSYKICTDWQKLSHILEHSHLKIIVIVQKNWKQSHWAGSEQQIRKWLQTVKWFAKMFRWHIWPSSMRDNLNNQCSFRIHNQDF